MTKIPGDKFLTIIDNIFTAQQCKSLIKIAENNGLEKIDRGIAIYHRVIIKNKDLADGIFKKIRHHLPQYFDGKKIIGLNDVFRFSKYYVGEEFGVHYDRVNQDSFGNRSVMTLNIFLNDDFTGGETDFFIDSGNTLRYSAKPKAGRGALFDSFQYHCGNKIKSGIKYLIRTDVMVSV